VFKHNLTWVGTPHPTLGHSEAVFTANHLTDADKQNSTGKYTN